MDYWPLLDWEAVDDWAEMRERLSLKPFWLIEECATRLVWEASFQPGDVVVFGSESRGLPPNLLAEFPGRVLKLPMRAGVRSLNLASTVNTVVYEAVRQFGGLPGIPGTTLPSVSPE